MMDANRARQLTNKANEKHCHSQTETFRSKNIGCVAE